MQDVYLEVKTKKKPAWVKLKAFRYKEHVGVSEDFEVGYRSKSDYLAWLAKDPLITEKFEDKTITKIDFEIDQAIEFAKNSPFPELADLYTNVIQ
jgi:pyruvate dehydrogenase E1 component alpha subunit